MIHSPTASVLSDVNLRRAMVRDTIFCGTVAEFMDRYAVHLEYNADLFPNIGEKGSILDYIRSVLTGIERGEHQAAIAAQLAAQSPKRAASNKIRASVIDGEGKTVETRLFDREHDAEGWIARKVAELPYHSGKVGDRTFDRDWAIARAWGVRRAGPAMAKQARHDGPWQKCQQTRVVLPKR